MYETVLQKTFRNNRENYKKYLDHAHLADKQISETSFETVKWHGQQ
jgi:hypothetical protein